MNAAHNGSGTTSHLSIEMLKQFAKVDVVPIPYKGGGPSIVSLVAGETDFSFATALAAQPHIKTGKVRPLAVTTAKRSGAFPDLPTMASLYPGFESDNWYAMFLPAGTPKEIVAKLNGEILKALRADDIRDFIVKEGGRPGRQLPGGAGGLLQARSRQVRQDHQGREHYCRINNASGSRSETPRCSRGFFFDVSGQAGSPSRNTLYSCHKLAI